MDDILQSPWHSSSGGCLPCLGGNMEQHVTAEIRAFITSAYLFDDESRAPSDDDSLLESGILDSTGVLELIEFLETRFGINVADNETVPHNLGTIANITRHVDEKIADTAGAA